MERLWLSRVANEVQTAAEAVAAYFELLMLQVGRPVESLSQTHGRVRRLSRSLGELASLVAAGPTGEARKPQAIALEDAVESAASTVFGEALLKQQRVVINIDDEANNVTADPRMLHRVLTSLLVHAVKATPVGGVVAVSARRGEGSWVVGVSDAGCPIDAKEPSRASRPFAQFHSPDFWSDEELGPGLALARQLVEAHHGDFWIERREEGGNTFLFSLVE